MTCSRADPDAAACFACFMFPLCQQGSIKISFSDHSFQNLKKWSCVLKGGHIRN